MLGFRKKRSYKELIVQDKPVSYWRLGESSTGSATKDEMGLQNGTYNATGTTLGATGAISGDSGTCAQRTTAGVITTVSHNAAYNLSTTLSLEAWVYIDGNPTDYARHPINKTGGDTISSANFIWYIFGSFAGAANSDIRKMNLFATATSWRAVTPSLYITPGRWNHVVHTYSSTAGGKVYLNGHLAGTNASTGAPSTNSYDVSLAIPDSSDSRLDEPAIYNYILSAEQVREHYLAGCGRRAKKPDSISGLQLWLKADAGVLNSSAAAAANGEKVDTWQDQSGNGNHVQQTTDANRPTYVTNAVNGLPALRYTANGALTRSIDWRFTDRTVFLAFKNDDSSSIHIILSNGGSNWYCGVNSGTRLISSWNHGGNTQATHTTSTSFTWTTVGSWSVASYRWTVYTTPNSEVFTTMAGKGNREQLRSTTGHTALSSATTWRVGGLTSGAGGNNLNGDLAEVLVYDNDLSEADTVAVEMYLAQRYGVSIIS